MQPRVVVYTTNVISPKREYDRSGILCLVHCVAVTPVDTAFGRQMPSSRLGRLGQKLEEHRDSGQDREHNGDEGEHESAPLPADDLLDKTA